MSSMDAAAARQADFLGVPKSARRRLGSKQRYKDIDIKSDDAARGRSDEPPLYTIDLSLPPAERYVAMAKDFQSEIQDLTGLFADLVHDIHPRLPVGPFSLLGKLFLRRLYNSEETEEIKGISKATGVDLYLLCAFNLLLDSFMGCSSGGILTFDKDDPARKRMLHYRTLDWGMDPLRKVVVRLQYVRSPSTNVIARAVTYVGYVGMLTGVKPGLSLSLNFRAEHDNSTRYKDFSYYWHIVLVMLGLRPSISSMLRQCITPHDQPGGDPLPLVQTTEGSSQLQNTVHALEEAHSCAAFLILSDGNETYVLEKDLNSCKRMRSASFIAAVNSDARHDPSDWSDFIKNNGELQTELSTSRGLQSRQALQFLIEESVDRKQCMKEKWEEARESRLAKHRNASDEDVAVSEEEVLKWLNDFPITNETTHYACLMDPKSGEILWCRRRKELAFPPRHLKMK